MHKNNNAKANSEALTMHIGRTLTCVLRHMWDISSSVKIERSIQYNYLVNSIATVASMVQSHVLVNQMCQCRLCM